LTKSEEINVVADYVARRIADPIEIDGNIDKPVWRNAAWSRRFVDMASGAPGLFDTKTALLWTDTHLYIAFWAEEPMVEAHLLERDSLIFQENDLEVFIDGGDCYYELEVNAANTIYEVFFVWRDVYKKGGKFDLPGSTYRIPGPTHSPAMMIEAKRISGAEPIPGARAGHLPASICRV
jgi:hypothetical protein